MSHWTQILAYGHGGLVTTALAAAGALVLVRTPYPRGSRRGVNTLAAAATLPALIELVLSSWYLLSPTYIDHIEASAASVTHYFRQGIALYPGLRDYTFHGMVYGPLLAEVNSLGYLLGSGAAAAKLAGWLAAWLAVALLLGVPRTIGPGWTRLAAIASVLCVLTSFGAELTADRADSLLILAAISGFLCVLRSRSLVALAAVAALAGATAALKLHGPVYLAPALYWWTREQTNRGAGGWLGAAVVAAAAGAAAAALPFLPANVSLAGYLDYLLLAARHGLASQELGWNGAFLLGLWAPVGIIYVATRLMPRGLSAFAGVLAATELLVAIIAGKPGAGIHHLLPFLGYHAFLLQGMLAAAATGPRGEPAALRGAAVALAAVLCGAAEPAAAIFNYFLQFDLHQGQQQATLRELQGLSARYPGAMLGVSDEQTYAITNFRTWLTLSGTRQTDYGALMDLRLSGVSDAPLANAFGHCEIPYLFMPKGMPFSMLNRYGGPLFSDAVREEFHQRYTLVQSADNFDVYECTLGRVR